jgi:hypothetical protein
MFTAITEGSTSSLASVVGAENHRCTILTICAPLLIVWMYTNPWRMHKHGFQISLLALFDQFARVLQNGRNDHATTTAKETGDAGVASDEEV